MKVELGNKKAQLGADDYIGRCFGRCTLVDHRAVDRWPNSRARARSAAPALPPAGVMHCDGACTSEIALVGMVEAAACHRPQLDARRAPSSSAAASTRSPLPRPRRCARAQSAPRRRAQRVLGGLGDAAQVPKCKMARGQIRQRRLGNCRLSGYEARDPRAPPSSPPPKRSEGAGEDPVRDRGAMAAGLHRRAAATSRLTPPSTLQAAPWWRGPWWRGGRAAVDAAIDAGGGGGGRAGPDRRRSRDAATSASRRAPAPTDGAARRGFITRVFLSGSSYCCGAGRDTGGGISSVLQHASAHLLHFFLPLAT